MDSSVLGCARMSHWLLHYQVGGRVQKSLEHIVVDRDAQVVRVNIWTMPHAEEIEEEGSGGNKKGTHVGCECPSSGEKNFRCCVKRNSARGVVNAAGSPVGLTRAFAPSLSSEPDLRVDACPPFFDWS